MRLAHAIPHRCGKLQGLIGEVQGVLEIASPKAKRRSHPKALGEASRIPGLLPKLDSLARSKESFVRKLLHQVHLCNLLLGPGRHIEMAANKGELEGEARRGQGLVALAEHAVGRAGHQDGRGFASRLSGLLEAGAGEARRLHSRIEIGLLHLNLSQRMPSLGALRRDRRHRSGISQRSSGLGPHLALHLQLRQFVEHAELQCPQSELLGNTACFSERRQSLLEAALPEILPRQDLQREEDLQSVGPFLRPQDTILRHLQGLQALPVGRQSQQVGRRFLSTIPDTVSLGGVFEGILRPAQLQTPKHPLAQALCLQPPSPQGPQQRPSRGLEL
mmetsp:Transcript_90625/g.259139  ORF Transcript_90625/g.259139 Transcript_90625/m.259139 type:complete len:332 (-) Transcript_90625:158-1153(-)